METKHLKNVEGIYKITNTVNNKMYIGSSIKIKKRIYNHIVKLKKNTHSNKHLQRSWNKYSRVNFKVEILETTKNLLKREQYYINKLDVCNRDIGYNIVKDVIKPPMLGRKHSEETKKKMLKKAKGRIISEKQKNQISKFFTGRKQKRKNIEKRINSRKLNNNCLKKWYLEDVYGNGIIFTRGINEWAIANKHHIGALSELRRGIRSKYKIFVKATLIDEKCINKYRHKNGITFYEYKKIGV